ncbi:hypothetical protein LUQ84_000721 [Hamiltosporidium tvaerminnensis]|nr:hypothetical protein LUQ84_000721 [Hamiltosporidium tvaerminnensis]
MKFDKAVTLLIFFSFVYSIDFDEYFTRFADNKLLFCISFLYVENFWINLENFIIFNKNLSETEKKIFLKNSFGVEILYDIKKSEKRVDHFLLNRSHEKYFFSHKFKAMAFLETVNSVFEKNILLFKKCMTRNKKSIFMEDYLSVFLAESKDLLKILSFLQTNKNSESLPFSNEDSQNKIKCHEMNSLKYIKEFKLFKCLYDSFTKENFNFFKELSKNEILEISTANKYIGDLTETSEEGKTSIELYETFERSFPATFKIHDKLLKKVNNFTKSINHLISDYSNPEIEIFSNILFFNNIDCEPNELLLNDKVIIFDLDDTLYEKNTGLVENIHTNVDSFSDLLGINKSLFKNLYEKSKKSNTRYLIEIFKIRKISFENIHEIFYGNIPYNDKLDKNSSVIEIFKGIKSRKICFTNGSHIHAIKCLNAIGLLEYFDAIFSSYIGEQDVINKPNADSYNLITNFLFYRKFTIYFYDDKEKNLELPIKLGWKCFLINEDILERMDGL